MTAAQPMPAGVRVALDWGERRIGVAACDRFGQLAFPVATVAAADPWAQLAAIVADYEPVGLILGYPLTLAGEPGLAAQRIAALAPDLATRLGVAVWFVDERLTSAEAADKLRAAGRTSKQQRQIVDQQAAVAILETVLAAERAGQAVAWPLEVATISADTPTTKENL
ncbi:MAG: Holliday junction resolvase RuvX [Propionibacteriaceae bacterium]|jgi:putative Holliday junction resolvase|nr:Holliday junction resolvase RuvX [Propionibacteriaceae bacterium]